VSEPATLEVAPEDGLHPDAERGELVMDAMAELVVAERGIEGARTPETRELDSGHRTAAGRLGPHLLCVHDLTGLGDFGHPRELDPLHVPDDHELHEAEVSHPDLVPRFNG